MSTIAALEQQLRRHPHDEASWLVYSDHLEGQGDPRGELIRLEDRHASAPAGGDQQQLASAIKGLVEQHQSAWSAAAPTGRTVRLQWQHGFVVGVRLGWTEAAGGALRRFLTQPEGRLLRTIAVTQLGDEPQAEPDPDEESEDFDEETGMPRRRFDPNPMTAALESLLSCDLSRLQTLSFAYLGMHPAGAKVLASAKGLAQLEQLDLRYNALKNSGLQALCGAPFLPQLKALFLQRNELGAAGIKALAAIDLPHLTVLDLRHNDLKGPGAKALATSKLVSGLSHLNLQRNDVGPVGVKALAQSSLLPPALLTLWKGLHAAQPSASQDE